MNETRTFLENIFAGKQPLRRGDRREGESKYYFWDPRHRTGESQTNTIDIPDSWNTGIIDDENGLRSNFTWQDVVNARQNQFGQPVNGVNQLQTGQNNQSGWNNDQAGWDSVSKMGQNTNFSGYRKGINELDVNKYFPETSARFPTANNNSYMAQGAVEQQIEVGHRDKSADYYWPQGNMPKETFVGAYNFIKPYEGISPYLYLDINGNPTIGRGRMLNSKEAFMALPLYYKNPMMGMMPTSQEDKLAEWNRIQEMKAAGMYGTKYGAGVYAPHTQLYLGNDEINRMFAQDISNRYDELMQYPWYQKMPTGMQIPILDAHYHVGISDFNDLRQAAENGEYFNVCKELHRADNGNAGFIRRNKEAQAMCYQAIPKDKQKKLNNY